MTEYKPVQREDHHGDETDDDTFVDDIPLQDTELRSYDAPSINDNDNDDTSESVDEIEIEKQQHQSVPKWKQFNTYGSLIKSNFIAALPRFCQPGGLKVRDKLHPTSYLDALRGYAAWIVFMYHSFNTYEPSWRRQPFISVLFAGQGMVALFYVISGYVLSYNLLKNMRRREASPTLQSLASSTFRRYLRLYGSTTLAIFVTLIMVRLKWYKGRDNTNLLYKPEILDQLGDWLLDTFFFLNPFGDNIRGYFYYGCLDSKYLGTMWTIPVEFRGSIILFSFCAAVCKLGTRSRMVLTMVIILLCYAWNALYVAQFLYGMFAADLSLGRHPERLARTVDIPNTRQMPLEHESQRQSIVAKICYSLLFVLAIFLLGQPDHTDLGVWGDTPWAYLKSFIPPWYTAEAGIYWYLSIGAFLLVLSLDSYPTLHRPLEWGVSQYLGELSFGIYALHPPLMFGFYKGWEEPFREKYLGHSPFAFIPGVLALMFFVVVLADYFNRVDQRVINFGRWLQKKAFRNWEN